MILWAVALLPLLIAAPAGADSGLAQTGLSRGDTVAVASVSDAETLRLSDGRELRLAAIEAAHALAPRTGSSERPDARLVGLADAARAALAKLTAGGSVTLYLDRQ